jgi:hypothetical protein
MISWNVTGFSFSILFTFIQDELKSVEEIQQKFQQIIKSYTET